MSADEKWQKAKRVLCIRLDSLGDVLMTTPALRALKDTQPERKITLLTSTSGAEIASLIPEVDEALIYNPPWMKATQLSMNARTEFQIIERLKQFKFDAAVIFTTFSQSALPAAVITFMSDIPLRLAHCRENPYHLLTHWALEVDHFDRPHIRHEVRRQLDLVASIGSHTRDESLSLCISTEATQNMREHLQQLGLDLNSPWLIIHPGATAKSRRYPPENFAHAAQSLVSQYNYQVLFTGTSSEVQLIETIRSRIKAKTLSLAGQLNIQQFSALIALAPLLITNNTGPVHIAAAVRTPVVDLYALTNPQHTPWQVPHRVLYHDVPCKYCYKSICPLGHQNCLTLVPPELVVEAALDLMNEVKMLSLQGQSSGYQEAAG